MGSIRLLYALFVTSAALHAQPNFAREVSRIFQQNCQTCHRPNDIAPFSLLTYEDAVTRGRGIRSMVASRSMPPWKPVEGHGDFKNVRRLSDADRQAVLDWVDAGMPLGDPADLPPPTQFSNDWRLGAPDQVVALPQPYTPVPRQDRPDRYRCFAVKDVVDADRWVKTVDVQPGARQVVHHVLLYLTDSPKEIAKLDAMDAEDPQPGYDCWGGPRISPGAGPGFVKAAGGILGGWAPGAQPMALSPDIGILIPKGTALVIQVHYHLDDPDSPAPEDTTRVGLYFHAQAPKNRLLTLPVVNTTFRLEPGVIGKEVPAEFALDLAALAGITLPDFLMPKFSAIAVAPHMHQLGHKFKADLYQPDETQVPMIQIDDWDFHWQGFYEYAKPVPLPYRSTVKATCTFDNPTDRTVTWGESTDDEMCLLYVGFIAEGGISGLLFGNP